VRSDQTRVDSKIVGIFRLAWLLCSYVWRSGRTPFSSVGSSQNPVGRGCSSLAATGQQDSIGMLVVRRIHVTSSAPRWLLISGSVVSLGVYRETSRSGRSWVGDGNSGAVGGVEGLTIPTILT